MITFNFSVNETNLILESLSDLPHKRVNELINKIISTANEQLNQSEKPAE